MGAGALVVSRACQVTTSASRTKSGVKHLPDSAEAVPPDRRPSHPHDTVSTVDGLDEQSQKKVNFTICQYIDALSRPTS